MGFLCQCVADGAGAGQVVSLPAVFKTHRLLAVAYLVLVFHSVVLMKFSYWGEFLGPLMALLMVVGSVAAFIILFRRVGLSRRAVGVVEQITYHKAVRVLELAVRIKGRWAGHARRAVRLCDL